MADTLLSQTEINALIAGAKGTADGSAGGSVRAAPTRAVKTYDFRRPDKFSKDQLRTLQALHENIGRVAAARLSAKLRTTVTMSLADTSQMIYDEYVSGLMLPTQLVPMQAPQFGGPFLLDVDLLLSLGWIDRMLGGDGTMPKEAEARGHVPTNIEAGLFLKIVDELVPAVAEGWSTIEQVSPRVGEPALGPSLLRIAAPSDVVAVMTFEVRYEVKTAQTTSMQASSMSICLPYATLEPVLSRLSATAWYAQADRGVDGQGRPEIASTLEGVEVPLTAILGGVELSVDQLAGLKPGDVIRFGERADHPVRLSVMDQAMAWALPGKVGDRIALRLLTPLQQLLEA
jgi:flagellar motor switch protein FliM